MNGNLAVQFGQDTGQGWQQLVDLAIALALCSLIGLERELRQKSAGLRTHTLVGLGSALFLLISKYGFSDVLQQGEIMLDPSRLAAQIVSGIGFIGGGLIFVRRDIVRGLTTAAVVWVSVAVGCAAGAGLPILAAFVTAAHFLVVYGYPPLIRLLTRTRPISSVLRVNYRDGQGALRDILAASTEAGYAVEQVSTYHSWPDHYHDEDGGRVGTTTPIIDLRLRVVGPRPVSDLLALLSEQPGVLAVDTGEIDDTSE
ncbi:MAG: MgtC/SapB family protein [Pseudonocardiaceae bacterium]|nr:MgtC/SapB family protein [Pseudonocardiaceae bacterium]